MSRETKLGGEGSLGSLLPGLFAKLDLKLSAEHARGKERGQEVALQPISNAYRHLLALALHYSVEKPDRLVLARTPDYAQDGTGKNLNPTWMAPDSEFIRRPADPGPGRQLEPVELEHLAGAVAGALGGALGRRAQLLQAPAHQVDRPRVAVLSRRMSVARGALMSGQSSRRPRSTGSSGSSIEPRGTRA